MVSDATILVTGAGGFIGGRVVEALLESEAGRVRAGLHRWAGGARIGRYPVEMLVADVTRMEDVERAVSGADAVVHCAVGPHDVIVDGTRNVLEASSSSGVRRVIHLSTVDVYGRVDGHVDEEAPLVGTGAEYGDAKVEAEEICRTYQERRGLPVVILRPTLVYGPFSELWTIEVVQRMVDGDWRIPLSGCTGTCNLLYVDDLVRAVILALETDGAVGEAFNVNGPERPTWAEYFQAMAESLGVAPLESASSLQARLSSAAMMPVRRIAKRLLGAFEDPVMELYQRSRLARRAMKRLEHAIRMTPTASEFPMYRRRVSYSGEKARRLLGFEPVVGLGTGLELTTSWLRHHGFLDTSRENRFAVDRALEAAADGTTEPGS